MPTKKQTTSTNTYAPGALQNYTNWANQLNPFVSSMMSNPFSSPFYNLNIQQQTKAANSLSQRTGQNALQNFGMQNLGLQGSGLMNSLLAKAGRYGSQLQYQGFTNAANNAQSNMWNAAQLGSNFFGNPLVTGGQQTQTTSGLGTWLPQVLGAAAGIATGGFGGGGLSSLFGGGGGGTSGLPLIGQSGVGSGSMSNYTMLNPMAGGLQSSGAIAGGSTPFFNPLVGTSTGFPH